MTEPEVDSCRPPFLLALSLQITSTTTTCPLCQNQKHWQYRSMGWLHVLAPRLSQAPLVVVKLFMVAGFAGALVLVLVLEFMYKRISVRAPSLLSSSIFCVCSTEFCACTAPRFWLVMLIAMLSCLCWSLAALPVQDTILYLLTICLFFLFICRIYLVKNQPIYMPMVDFLVLFDELAMKQQMIGRASGKRQHNY